MGGIFYFDRMLPVAESEQRRTGARCRQLEVFTHGGKLYLRLGEPDAENEGGATVELSEAAYGMLATGLRSAGDFLGLRVTEQ